MPVDYKKTILKTALYTLLVLVAVFAVFVMLMFFVFTKNMADFSYNIGWNNMASNLYYKVYEKNGEIIYCYKALNIKIGLKDSEKIIEYYDAFVEDDEYSKFMIASKTNSESLNIGNLEKSALLNDENYLLNHYVNALINEDQSDKALQIAINELSSYDDFSLREQGVYALTHFVNLENWEIFDVVYDAFNESLIAEMQMYFDNAYTTFVKNQNSQDQLDKAYLISLGNRIIKVGQDINRVYTALDINSENINFNIEKMVEVNEVIKGLV